MVGCFYNKTTLKYLRMEYTLKVSDDILQKNLSRGIVVRE